MEQCYLSNNSLESVPRARRLRVPRDPLAQRQPAHVHPKELGNLVALETLDLSDNLLETLPSELANLDLLEQLDIYNNNFKKLPKASRPADPWKRRAATSSERSPKRGGSARALFPRFIPVNTYTTC